MTRNYIAGLICLFLFVACTGKDRLLENALTQAGTNRVELEKVLDHYRDTDEEKYRAATTTATRTRRNTVPPVS